MSGQMANVVGAFVQLIIVNTPKITVVIGETRCNFCRTCMCCGYEMNLISLTSGSCGLNWPNHCRRGR